MRRKLLVGKLAEWLADWLAGWLTGSPLKQASKLSGEMNGREKEKEKKPEPGLHCSVARLTRPVPVCPDRHLAPPLRCLLECS